MDLPIIVSGDVIATTAKGFTATGTGIIPIEVIDHPYSRL
jgi:hypothetical protein